ncbi:MAG: glycosyltransferase family 2 protein [Candidatus Thorarchaeota archaeon]
MKIIIGIPIWNEESYLSECVSSLYAFLEKECQDYDIQICLVDDASTDGSQGVYERLARKFPFSYIRTAINRGYGATILTLFEHARDKSDILVTFDADLQHAPITIKEILQIMEIQSDIDVVSTSRYLSYRFWDRNTPVPIDRYLTNMFLTRAINRCLDLQITDAFCGLKGYRTTKIPARLDDAEGYTFPLVYWNYASHAKLHIHEIPTPIIYRLDRRGRGVWKERLKEYFLKFESILPTLEKKQGVWQDYRFSVKKMTYMLDNFIPVHIQTYHDFLKSSWVK